MVQSMGSTSIHRAETITRIKMKYSAARSAAKTSTSSESSSPVRTSTFAQTALRCVWTSCLTTGAYRRVKLTPKVVLSVQ
jgi:hypothetical protein